MSPTDSAVNGEDGSHFQVLALDGGGVGGMFTAAVLAGIEEDIRHPVLDHFDLVVGTSAGGIIALALGAGLTPHQIRDLYLRESPNIFPGPRPLRSIRRICAAKYSPAELERVVQHALGSETLGNSKVPLVIPSYNLGENSVYLFKTPHHERLRRDWRVPMWQVAMATSSAPTFFPAYTLPAAQVRLIDGGVWANNPAMVGVAEAVSIFGKDLKNIRVLSLGTTSSPKARARRLDKGGLFQWVTGPNIVEVLLSGQGAGTFAQVQHLLGAQNAYRLNPQIADTDTDLDRVDSATFIASAAHHSRQFTPKFLRMFSDHICQPYTPCYGPRAEEPSYEPNSPAAA